SLDNGIGSVETKDPDYTNNVKYNFNELHISETDHGVDKSSEMKEIQPPLPKVFKPIDPFGPFVK
ncbi:MAG TPA: hypothetical protein VF884_01605, partial [Nitrososphaeraceae archaeon]